MKYIGYNINLHFLFLVSLMCLIEQTRCCGPGGRSGRRRYDRYKKITPLVFKQHVPNVSENTLTASGHSEGRISRDDKRFRDLIPNYNQDIIFKDDEGTGADRLMTQRLKEKLNTLAISVMNQWPGVRLRVTEGWEEEKDMHAVDSLHYEGRAVDITTSDRDSSKYGLLARLAVEAGFDWVYYESRYHIHCSVKSETTQVNGKGAGCFTADSKVTLDNHKVINITDLNIGDRVLTLNTVTGEMEYSEVLLFLHRDADLVHSFVEISTESGTTIKLTPSHLLLRWRRQNSKTILNDVEYTYAESVAVNDSILVHKDKAYVERVTSIRRVVHTGVYAPLTSSGTIVVDDVLASCYAVIDNQFLAHLSFSPIRFYHRIVNLFSSNHIVDSSHVKGIHWYPRILYSLSDYVIPSGWMDNN
uniref:Hedgehog protein n=1 Tax=Cacopsylla melanoneura TaxID=428564 RepID=A0A8D8T2N3_9HEMI